MRGLLERLRLPAGADSAHSQAEGARITSCPPTLRLRLRLKAPPSSPIASALWMT